MTGLIGGKDAIAHYACPGIDCKPCLHELVEIEASRAIGPRPNSRVTSRQIAS